MTIQLLVNGLMVFSSENVAEEIKGKVENKDLYIGLYLQGKRGTPFQKLHVEKAPDVLPIPAPEIPAEKVMEKLSFFPMPNCTVEKKPALITGKGKK